MSAVVCIVDNEIDLNRDLDEALFVFGEKEVQRLQNIKNPRHKAESVSARIALKMALQCCNVDTKSKDTNIEIEREESGRPCFASYDKADFSLSHSGSLSVAVLNLGKIRVGVDIQIAERDSEKELCSSHKRISSRFFSECELEKLNASDDHEKEFLKIWTAKEALAKMSGEGLSGIISQKNNDTEQNVFCEQYQIVYKDDAYIMTLCSQKEFSAKIEIVRPDQCLVKRIG